MKTIKRTFQTLSTIVLTAMLFIACSENDEFAEDLNNTPTEEHISNCATMYLEGSKKDYDATRNTTTTWEEGDKLHLQFKVENAFVNGVATYQAETQDWNVQYYGTLTTGEEATCEVYQFITEGESSRTIVDLDQHSIIYADKAATYIYEGDVLKITANLTPMTGRIRFKGDANTSYRFSGLTYYTAYDIVSNTFLTADFPTTISETGSDGYSAYYYLVIPENDNKLCFDDYSNCVSFTKSLSGNALKAGHSGFLNIPTLESFNGWELFTYKDFTYSNITFRMIRVLTESSHYYVGETEVTQELWKAIMGSNPSTHTGEKNLPVETVTLQDCIDFITKLNAKLGGNFCLPKTTDEWTFAAKGAGASKGFTYCGSNTLSDVAWYADNSDGKTHPVKTKLPNEIGIYDMHGNVREWNEESHYISSYYGYQYYSMGGTYLYNPYNDGFSENYYQEETSGYSDTGLRLFQYN